MGDNVHEFFFESVISIDLMKKNLSREFFSSFDFKIWKNLVFLFAYFWRMKLLSLFWKASEHASVLLSSLIYEMNWEYCTISWLLIWTLKKGNCRKSCSQWHLARTNANIYTCLQSHNPVFNFHKIFSFHISFFCLFWNFSLIRFACEFKRIL